MNEKLEILLDYQKKWLEDESSQKLSEKSRRIGLSYTEALASVLYASKQKNWQNTYYLSYNKDMTKQFILDCAFWAMALQSACSEIMEDYILDDENKDVLIYRIKFASGAEIVGLPSEAYALRSKKGRVVFDEGAFCKNFEEVLKAAQALLIWGGQLVVISTHNGEDNPFNQLVKSVREGRDNTWSLHRTTFDQAINAGLYKRICLVNGWEWSKEAEAEWVGKIRNIYKDNAQEELDVIPASGTGKYFNRGMLDACCRDTNKIIRWSFPNGFLHKSAEHKKRYVEKLFNTELAPIIRGCKGKVFIGEDFARSGDLTVYWILEQLVTVCEVRAILEVKNCPFEEQENTGRMILQTAHESGVLGGMAIDARGNGQQIAETLSLEFPGAVEPIMETASWYATWFSKLRALIETEDFTLPKDETILADFGIVVLKNGNPYIPDIRLKDRDGTKRHGDGALSAVLACYAVHECVSSAPPIFQSVPKKTRKQTFSWFR